MNEQLRMTLLCMPFDLDEIAVAIEALRTERTNDTCRLLQARIDELETKIRSQQESESRAFPRCQLCDDNAYQAGKYCYRHYQENP